LAGYKGTLLKKKNIAKGELPSSALYDALEDSGGEAIIHGMEIVKQMLNRIDSSKKVV